MMEEAQSSESVLLPSLYKPAALLPIAKHKRELLYTIETYPVTIVIGQTGSGKTTQLPQFLEEGGWCNGGKVVAVTQPRRVAATSVAARVAEEKHCKLGHEVGYSIRFEDLSSEKTRIKFLTDGLLLREALVDPLLSRYSIIMVDEAHERSISSDLLLGLLKKIMKKRPDLRIVISSATLQAEDFLRFFTSSETQKTESNGSSSDDVGRILFLGGRMYPVDIHHLSNPTENYVEKAIDTVFDIHTKETKGDVLVFMSGREEIDTVVGQIQERSQELKPGTLRLQPMALFAGLTTEQQMDVFEPSPEDTRKVIVATNIAEASVTIDGIVYVVDSGFVKLRAYNPNTGIDALTATPISRASATQRAGRAGRTKPGKCYRLYTEKDFSRLAEHTSPEIQRSNLAPIILQMKALGIDNIAKFDFLTSPPSQLVVRALELLYSLKALDEYARLTKPIGTRMAELALEPMMAKALLSGRSFDCLSEMLTIAAMTNVQGSIWFHHDGERKATEAARRKFAAEEGDHLTLLNVYQTFVTRGKKEAKWCRDNFLNFKTMSSVVSVRNQLRRYLERLGVNVDESLPNASTNTKGDLRGVSQGEKIRRCLTTGFFAHAARMQPNGTFKTVDGSTVLHVHPTSLMFNRKADWVIFHEIMETSSKTFIRDISKIEKSWLLEYAPEFYKIK